MKHYTLQANESVLYKNEGRLLNESDKKLESDIELILTNLRLIFVKKRKKLFSEEIEIEAYPIEEIKIYNEVPQIKQAATRAEVYLTTCEKTVELFSRIEVRKFINSVYKLLTGKTQVKRGAGKVKDALDLVDDTLGIDTAGTVQSVVEGGVVGALFGKKKKNHSRTEVVTGLLDSSKKFVDNRDSESLNLPTDTQPTTSIDNDVDTLKKLKDLLDAGIISQNEFDAKKKQILGI